MTRRFPPETPAQVVSWDRVKNNAVRFGLCERCAAQLAWAHQSHTGSFPSVHPPCEACAPLVATLPKGRPNGWRTVNGSADKPSSWQILAGAASGVFGIHRESVTRVIRAPVTAPEAFPASEGVSQ